jgi:hypothetical protein
MIGLDLDDDAADAVDQQRRTDQVGCDVVHAAGEEGALQRLAQFGCGLRGGEAALSHSNVGAVKSRLEERKMRWDWQYAKALGLTRLGPNKPWS